ncbi:MULTISPECIES: hypothetical protein [Peribacillus]|uniref:hypothetical protein n=1 Tax=Peribacillus TaxID=2675229 RepID=UPI00333D378E
MKELAELRRIVDGQKTVSTKRLKPLLDEIQKSYIQTANKVKSQKETIKKINTNYSVANSKAARLSVHVQTHEDTKIRWKAFYKLALNLNIAVLNRRGE